MKAAHLPAVGDVAPPAGWLNAWQRWRDRRLTDPGFIRWAQRFPLTRWVARRRALRLFDLMSGFVYSQVLSACVSLGWFDRLARGPLPWQELTPAEGPVDAARLRQLLDAAVALELLEHRGGGRVGLGALGAPLAADPALAAMVKHHAVLYADLRDPLGLMARRSATATTTASPPSPEAPAPGATGRSAGGADASDRPPAMADYWPYAERSAGRQPRELSESEVAEYSALMTASQPLVGEQVVHAVPWGRWRHLLDIGGGEGRFAEQVAAAAPGLRITVFDLPAVAHRAQARLQTLPGRDRLRAAGGDFLQDPLPEGVDLVSLVRVLFDHPDERCAVLLRRIHAHLPSGGSVLVAEPMAGVRGCERMGAAYYGFYLMAMGHGRARTAAEHAALLCAAGFEPPKAYPTAMPLQASVLIARKP